MREIFSSFSLVVVLLHLLAACQVQAQEPKPALTVAVTQSNLMPLKWEQEGEYVGPMIELIKTLSERSGVKLEIVAQPLARTLMMIKSGAIDGAFGNYKNPERAQFATYFNPPLAFLEVGLFARNTTAFQPQKLEELVGKTIIKINGHSVNKAFDALEQAGKFRIVRVYEYESMVEMLHLGRADFAVGPSAAIAQIIQEKGYDKDLKRGELVFNRRPIYFYLSKQAPNAKQPEVHERLQMAMDAMCLDGTYQYYTGVNECLWGRRPPAASSAN